MEWFLFELERDLLVRSEQFAVVEGMAAPENRIDRTALCSSIWKMERLQSLCRFSFLLLANGEQLCRVTVALSIPNECALPATSFGRTAERPSVHNFSCNRETSVDKDGRQGVSHQYAVNNECLPKKGVVLTTSEDRLSVQLKAIECISERHKECCEIYRIEQRLREISREIVDEPTRDS